MTQQENQIDMTLEGLMNSIGAKPRTFLQISDFSRLMMRSSALG